MQFPSASIVVNDGEKKKFMSVAFLLMMKRSWDGCSHRYNLKVLTEKQTDNQTLGELMK